MSKSSNNIIINFSLFPFCLRTTSIGEYTNKLKDVDQFLTLLSRLFEKDMPAISQSTYDNISNETRGHSHSILVKDSKYNKVISILKELYKTFYNPINLDKDFELFLQNNINDYQVWQLGTSGGIRLIGIRQYNIFNVLFIDYHHLLYPSKHYNQENYNMYNFCPMTNKKYGGN